MNQNETIPSLRRVLLNCLAEGGKIMRKGFGRKHSIQWKGPISIVTEVDLAIEKKIVQIIQKNFPAHQILTEESAPKATPSPYRWIIDPLDGTTNFSHGLPICATSIGLEKDGKVILGGVYNPLQNEIYFAERGRGAFCNEKRIRVSQESKLINSLLVTGFPYDRHEQADKYLRFVKRMIETSQGLRRLGAAALDLCYVASGTLEAFWEFHLMPWDVAAGALLVEEAGGKITDAHGKPFNVSNPTELLAANAKVHGKILSEFRKIFNALKR